MVGAWMLGLDVQHTYDTAFCCADVALCNQQDHRRTGVGAGFARALQASEKEDALSGLHSLQHVGDRVARRLRQTEVVGGKTCALYSGACNGVCGIQRGPDWDALKKCVAIS
jgi:hypothetical protein